MNSLNSLLDPATINVFFRYGVAACNTAKSITSTVSKVINAGQNFIRPEPPTDSATDHKMISDFISHTEYSPIKLIEFLKLVRGFKYHPGPFEHLETTANSMKNWLLFASQKIDSYNWNLEDGVVSGFEKLQRVLDQNSIGKEQAKIAANDLSTLVEKCRARNPRLKKSIQTQADALTQNLTMWIVFSLLNPTQKSDAFPSIIEQTAQASQAQCYRVFHAACLEKFYPNKKELTSSAFTYLAWIMNKNVWIPLYFFAVKFLIKRAMTTGMGHLESFKTANPEPLRAIMVKLLQEITKSSESNAKEDLSFDELVKKVIGLATDHFIQANYIYAQLKGAQSNMREWSATNSIVDSMRRQTVTLVPQFLISILLCGMDQIKKPLSYLGFKQFKPFLCPRDQQHSQLTDFIYAHQKEIREVFLRKVDACISQEAVVSHSPVNQEEQKLLKDFSSLISTKTGIPEEICNLTSLYEQTLATQTLDSLGDQCLKEINDWICSRKAVEDSIKNPMQSIKGQMERWIYSKMTEEKTPYSTILKVIDALDPKNLTTPLQEILNSIKPESLSPTEIMEIMKRVEEFHQLFLQSMQKLALHLQTLRNKKGASLDLDIFIVCNALSSRYQPHFEKIDTTLSLLLEKKEIQYLPFLEIQLTELTEALKQQQVQFKGIANKMKIGNASEKGVGQNVCESIAPHIAPHIASQISLLCDNHMEGIHVFINQRLIQNKEQIQKTTHQCFASFFKRYGNPSLKQKIHQV